MHVGEFVAAAAVRVGSSSSSGASGDRGLSVQAWKRPGGAQMVVPSWQCALSTAAAVVVVRLRTQSVWGDLLLL